ncbi:MAG: MBL fold metallo-hydrolase, partial [Shimia sp.]
MIVFNQRARLPVWADADTQDDLRARFGYAFTQPPGSSYPPILELNDLDGPVEVTGAGGVVRLEPFAVRHGGIGALGFRMGDAAYLPDVSAIPEESFAALEGLSVWIVDALRRDPHPSHSHLANTLAWIERVRPARAVLTNMHIDMDYAEVDAETPDHVTPAFDGMVIESR